MLIGESNLDYEVIRKLAGDKAGLVAYVENLVPTWARHIPQIVSNQRYYAAIHIRNMLQMPFLLRKEMCAQLLKGCAVHGVINEFVPVAQLFEECDTEALIRLFRRNCNEVE